MSALTLLIIRHAEKPDRGWPGPGITVNGGTDDTSLVVRGWQRTGAWASLFGAGLGGAEFPRPALIYAADPNSTASSRSSSRPFETITPLAARLGLTPVVTFAVGDEAALVEALREHTGVVLVCWEHKAICGAIVSALAKGQVFPNQPAKWDGDRFDVVLRLDRALPDAPWSFRQMFPRLLSGDSDTPMA